MDLLLWRHAHALDATPGQSDMERPLSTKGEKQAQKMSAWLRLYLPKEAQILCSPALRATQTLSYLKMPYFINEELVPESNVASLLRVTGWTHEHARPTLVVGHQPYLAETVSQLLGLTQSEVLSFRKGAVWWIRRRFRNHNLEHFVLTVQDSELL